MIEPICWEGQVLTYVIQGRTLPETTTFLTPHDVNLQVGFVVYPAGGAVQRHMHLPVERHVVGTTEVLLVRRGRCELDVFNEARELVATRSLEEGDIVIAVGGGHGFRMQEDTVLMEVKQGPYPGVAEKERF